MNNRLFKHRFWDTDVMHSLYLALALALMLGGCTTTTAALYSGYVSGAKVGIQAADDNVVTTIHDLTCGLPYGALLRHPEMQPAAVSLCGGSSVTALLTTTVATTTTTTAGAK